MGKFTFQETEIKGVTIIEPTVFGDDRGYFMETYQYEAFRAAGISAVFVQDNQSKSSKGVLRGLHFHTRHPQGKLARVTKGTVYDVAVDIDRKSPTYGKYVGVILSEENKKQFYVPAGMAHGFLVLSDEAEFCYKCTDYYDPSGEGGILWNDPDVAIDWPLKGLEVKLSEKDQKQPLLRDLL
ncbi:dTDP-4-dehydrorhamnose 3,5-epimerase [Anaeromassilibacillus senegalensis]|uniref:dTDP-4-dehydrorhamnose 3,5-epimerase n=1 Tax=Anaeromassilibacillus senegalensis TaxID=1673717 RepID=UPI0006803595|nr:dTDP-4-dehydrorhamnose 3,5-epimerase [Anaeromassilibacillus senegalensis]